MQRLAILAALTFLSACGDDGGGESGVVVRFSVPASGRPRPLEVPFPSDVYRDDDGTIADDLTDWSLAGIDDPQPNALIAGTGALDGFGLQSGVLFGVSGLADDASLGAPSVDHVWFVNTKSGERVPCTVGWDDVARTITVIPRDVLVPGETYAVGLASGVAETVGASRDFVRLRDGGGVGDDGALSVYTRALDELVAAGAPRGDLIAATLYTTAVAATPMLATAERLYLGAYGAPPSLNTSPAVPFRATRFGRTAHAGWTATLDEWLGTPLTNNLGAEVTGFAGPHDLREAEDRGIAHDQIAAVISGTIVSPEFLRTFGRTAAYDDGTIEYDVAGNAVPARPDAEIPVTIVLPARAAPASGFPVVMLQHGLGKDRFLALSLANELARAGYATVAIDGFFHGLRDPANNDTRSNGTGTFTGPDGFADGANPLAILNVVGDLKNALRMRDSFWQFSFDLIAARRLIDNPTALASAADEFGGTTPTLDATKVAIVGHSLGGIMTTAFAAATPPDVVNPVVLTSPASNLGFLFGDSPVYFEQSTLLASAARFRATSFAAGPFSAAFQLIENVAVAADTGAFAAIAAAKHDIWVIGAQHDESVPWSALDQLVRAFGCTQVTPALRDATALPQAPSPYTTTGRMAAFFELAPANHDHTFERYARLRYEPPYPRPDGDRYVLLPSPLTIRQPVIGEQRAIAAFIGSAWAGTPTIDVTSTDLLRSLRPVPDLDDDGACDADERAANANPYDPLSRPAGVLGCERDLGFSRSAP